MRKSLAIVAALGLLAMGSAANAADAPRGPVYKGAPVYEAVSATSWAGWYAGLHAGWAWGDSNQRQGAVQTNDYDIDGFIGGAQLGYNWQRGQWVYGIETDFSFADIDGLHPIPGSGGYGCASGPCETEVNWFGTTRGRIGLATGSWLFFATGGLAYADLEARIRNSGPPFTGGETKFGWTVGAGAERMLASGWSVKVEYLYLDFDRFDFGTSTPQPTAEANFHVVRGGLNYWFR